MTDTLVTAERTVWQALEAAWAAATPDNPTPIAWPNVLFTPPTADTFDGPLGGVWVQPNILWGAGAAQTMGLGGVGQNEVTGIVQILVCAPKQVGMQDATTIAALARNVFNRRILNGIRFDAAWGPTHMPDAPEWMQLLVRCPFRLTEVTP